MKKNYAIGSKNHYWPRTLVIGIAFFILILLLSMVAVRQFYYANLSPVSDDTTAQEFIIIEGTLTPEIGANLEEKGLIRSAGVFEWYVKAKNAGDKILAGTYRLQPSMSTPQIVEVITRGQVATELFTIYPGQRIDQIRDNLLSSGFEVGVVDRALSPSTYGNHPALVDRPAGATLEGYLYPESFQRTTVTTPEDIIRASLDEMSKKLTSDIRSSYSRQGLSVYEAITLASVVEQEAFEQSDRNQVAQVFLKRLSIDMPLQSDPTAAYGAILDNQTPSLTYSSPYNTYQNAGLPPSPISNVSESSLRAVANPSNTDWLYFVAGDDKKTYFSKTLEEHEQLTELHCTTLCGN